MPPDGPSHDGVVGRAAKSAGKGLFRLITAPLRSKLFVLGALVTGLGAALIAVPALAKQFGGSGDQLVSWAPWMLRIGVSFLAAFIFAFFVRRVIKLALLVGGAAIIGAIAVHKLGIGLESSHVDAIKSTVQNVTAEAQAYADSTWATIKHYLPSGGAASAGLWRGARQKFEA